MKLAGSELSIYQLVEVLQWKLKNINRVEAATDIVDRSQDLYNSSQPINCLPLEILAHIFKAV